MPSFFTPPPSSVIATYFGASGGATTRYYWIQAIYAAGRSRLSAYSLATTVAGLSKDSRVLVTWDPMPGALGYNVFVTTSTTPPTTGAVAAAMGITANAFTDIGQSDSLSTNAVIIDGVTGLGVARARYSFATDGGAQSTITPSLPFNTLIPKNAILIGGTVNVITAVTSSGSATVGVGTSAGSSTTALLAATAKASLTLAALLNAVPVFATPVKMSAEGYITFTIGTADLTAGVIEVFILYVVPIAA